VSEVYWLLKDDHSDINVIDYRSFPTRSAITCTGIHNNSRKWHKPA